MPQKNTYQISYIIDLQYYKIYFKNYNFLILVLNREFYDTTYFLG